MLSYADIKPGQLILLDNEPFEVVSTSGVVKKQRQKPHNTAKLRGVRTGSVVEKTFSQADKIEEAEIETRDMRFIYSRGSEAVFANPNDPSDRFSLPVEIVERALPYLRSNDIVEGRLFDDEVFNVRVPIKVDLAVTEAPPNVKGNTAQGGTKTVVTETGLKVVTPMFVEAGDKIRVNTVTGEYVERAN